MVFLARVPKSGQFYPAMKFNFKLPMTELLINQTAMRKLSISLKGPQLVKEIILFLLHKNKKQSSVAFRMGN